MRGASRHLFPFRFSNVVYRLLRQRRLFHFQYPDALPDLFQRAPGRLWSNVS
jgi:hypothetical protein